MSIKQFALWRIRFEPELLAPVLKCLLRETVKLTILPLIHVAMLPSFIICPPETLALAHLRSVLFHHLALLICKSRARTDRVYEQQEKCVRNGRLPHDESGSLYSSGLLPDVIV